MRSHDHGAADAARQVPSAGPRPSRFGPGFDPDALADSEACRRAMDEIAAEIIAINEQVERACARYDETGQRSDSTWLIAAKTALSHRRRVRQRLQERLGMLRRAERQAAHAEARPFQEFWYAARDMLAEEEFNAVVREAMRRAGGGANG